MKRIVHCIWSWLTGGAEEMLLDIMRLQVADADVHLIIINDHADPAMLAKIPQGVTVHRLRRKPGTRSPWAIAKLNALILSLRPDAIHLHNRELPRVVLPGLKSKKVLTVHALGLQIEGLNSLRAVAAISEAVKEDLLGRYGLESTVIINGINVDAIAERPQSLPSAEFRVVQVGRLNAEQKGQDLLIKALAILKGRGHEGITVTLIGDGPDRQALEQLAQEQGVADSVIFEGMRPKAYIYSHLRDFDLMVHPARQEGFGLTIAEAMAACLPVAVPADGGPYEVTCQGLYAETFAGDDPEACALAIERAIADYPRLLSRLDDARAHALRHYSIARTVAQYSALYSRL